jgi:hypothetical protein
MAPYDYGQFPQQNVVYQPQYNTLPTQQLIDPKNQYSMVTPFSMQQPSSQTHYPSMMIYPPSTDTNLLPQPPTALSMQPISYVVGPSGGNFSYFFFFLHESIFRLFYFDILITKKKLPHFLSTYMSQ